MKGEIEYGGEKLEWMLRKLTFVEGDGYVQLRIPVQWVRELGWGEIVTIIKKSDCVIVQGVDIRELLNLDELIKNKKVALEKVENK